MTANPAPTNPVLDHLLKRRSVVAKHLGEPGPTNDELALMLTAAARVPDHKKLEPWRVIVVQGAAREALGRAAAAIHAQESPTDAPATDDLARFTRAPLVVAVVSQPNAEAPIPEWEQHLSCGAVCQNLLIAAGSLGYGAQWITEWTAYSPGLAQHLGLAAHERIAGFVYIGRAMDTPKERPRPNLAEKVTM